MSNLFSSLILLAYYLVVAALLPSLLKVKANLPDELVRKLQHMAYSFSVFLLLHLFSTWYAAIAGAALLIILGYPALKMLENTKFYNVLLVDRRPQGGELRMQLLYVQASFALLILIFWGLLGTNWRYLIAVAVMAWGFGDAAAALIGKQFGRKNVVSRYIEGSKTLEGTGAMIMAAAMAVFLTLFLYARHTWYASLVIAVIVAPVCGIVELFSRKGADTLTVPLSTALLILPLIHLCGLLGW